MRKFHPLSLLTILFCISNVYAQTPKSFPEDDFGFVQTLTTYIASNNRPESKEISTWIKTNLISQVSPEDFKTIKAATTVMLSKKVPLWPSYYKYFKMVQVMSTNADMPASITSKNHQILLQLIEGNSPDAVKQFNYYVEYLNDIYPTPSFYVDKVKKWTSTSAYSIEVENGLPVYVFDQTTLTGTTSTDTLQILETSGRFSPFTYEWTGKSGKITWRRAGYDESDVFVTFGAYKMDLSKPEINLDTATFQFKPFVEKNIQGKFTDKLFTSKAVAVAYPQFVSFDKVPIKINQEISLESGLGLDGSKMYATSTSRAEGAKLTIYNSKKKKIVEAESKRFLINNFKQIVGERTKVNFAFIDSTLSIFHPSSTLNYNLENKNLKITRENTNDARIPFVAPFFKMNLYVDQFDWNIDSNYAEMNSTAVNAKLPTIFESFEFYIDGVDSKYNQLLNIEPIVNLAIYSDNIGYRRLTIDEIARSWNASGYKAIEQLVFKLMEDGYLYYDRETGMVDLYDKLFLHAAIRKNPEEVNYDNIRLSSLTQGKVGRLLLDQKKLQLLGVEKSRLISSSNVMMNPTSDTVYVSENRGVVFKGRLTAGKFNFYADSISYDYDRNLFNFTNIDSMLVMVPTEQADSKGNQYYVEINTPIEQISGKLYISDPSNRNKSTKYTEYPYFDCNDTSVVTFNKTGFGDKYHPEKFYFQIHPFKLEQMNNINTDSIKFKGTLVSDGVFRHVETSLSITKDKTLGLNIQTGDKGLEIYNGKGKLFGDIVLDQEGLIANGHIQKENAHFYSEKFLIFPDTTYSTLSKWENVKNDKMVYPQLLANETKLTWTADIDSISLISSEDIQLYDNKATVTAQMNIIKNQLLADGKLRIDESEFKSDSILLGVQTADIFNTPTAINKSDKKIFTSNNSDIHIQMKNLMAEIRTPKDSISKYNFNHLLTDHNLFHWDIQNATISVDSNQAKDKYYEFADNKFKGVKLSSKSSQFDEKTREITLNGVHQILVADSKVIPENGILNITEGGVIDILNNATVVLNSDSSYHTIMNAQVEILNKDMMKGSGSYSFESQGTHTLIPVETFKTIEVTSTSKNITTSTYYTTASGEIDEDKNFKLSDQLFYKGKLIFNSQSRNIDLEGYAKTNFKKILDTDWFKIKQQMDAKSSAFSIDSLKNEFNQNIYTGLMLDLNEMTIYPRIIQSKVNSTDRILYQATGVMKTQASSPEILFGQNVDLRSKKEDAKVMRYNDETETIQYTGPFTLAENIAPNTALIYGSATYDKNAQQPFKITGSLSMDMWAPSEIRNMLSRFITDLHVTGVYVSLVRNKGHQATISRMVTDTASKIAMEYDMSQSGIINLPFNYPFTDIFNDVEFYWDNAEGTFKSFSPLSMLLFAGKPYTQKINGYIEIGPRGKEDFFNLYLTTASGDWIFIRHFNGELSIISSDAMLNSGISNLKEDKRSLKSGKEIVYKITVANPAIKDNFVSRMEDFKSTIIQ